MSGTKADITDDGAVYARYTRGRAINPREVPTRGSTHRRACYFWMYLDIALIAVMLISGLLAMVRGFMREVLSIAAWGCAAVATLYAYSRLLPYAKQYFNNDYVASGVTIGGVFLLTLIIISALTVRISDKILDSRIGALDRALGFVFGLARGLLIVVVAFIFFDWLVPPKSQPEMVRDARSRVVLKSTGDWLMSLLPEDPENTILKRLKKKKPGDEEAPEGAADQHTENRNHDAVAVADWTLSWKARPELAQNSHSARVEAL